MPPRDKGRRKGPARSGRGGLSHPAGKSSKFRALAADEPSAHRQRDAVPELSEDSSQPSFLDALDRLAAEASESESSSGPEGEEGAGEEGAAGAGPEAGGAAPGGRSGVVVPGAAQGAAGGGLASRLAGRPLVRRGGFEESSSGDGEGSGADKDGEKPTGGAPAPGALSLDEFISRATEPMRDRHAAAALDLEAQAVGDRLGGVSARVLGEQEKLEASKQAVRRQVLAEAGRWTSLVDLQSRPDMVMSFGQARPRPALPDAPARAGEMDALLEAARLGPGGPGALSGLEERAAGAPGLKEARRQSAEIARLRAVLAANEQKLRRWAKIKSRSFRKIHNREKRVQRRERDLQRIREEQERLDRGQIWGDNEFDGWAPADAGALRAAPAADRPLRDDEEVFRLARLARELGESNPYTDFANQILDLQYGRSTMTGAEFAAHAAEAEAEERQAELEAQEAAEAAARAGVDLEAAGDAPGAPAASKTDVRANYLQRRIREQKRIMSALEGADEEERPQSGRMILGDLEGVSAAARPFEDSSSDEFAAKRARGAGGASRGKAGKPARRAADEPSDSDSGRLEPSEEGSRGHQRVAEVWDDGEARRPAEAPAGELPPKPAEPPATRADGPDNSLETQPRPRLGPARPHASGMMRPTRGRMALAPARAAGDNPFLSGEVAEAAEGAGGAGSAAAAKTAEAAESAEGGAGPRQLSVRELAGSLEATGPANPAGPAEEARKSDVRDAFSGALPEDDFQFQKQAMAREQLEAPELEEGALPGWGSWVGAGMSQQRRRELSAQHAARRAAAKAELDRQMRARADANLSWVAVAEAGANQAAANYAARGLYRTSDAEYAEYLATAVSPEWQSVSAFRASIQPKRVVEKSRVIAPAQVEARYVNHMQGERQIEKLRRYLGEQEKKMHKTASARQTRKVKF